MWKLTIEDDEGKPTSLPLVHDEYTLGRGETNAIRLTDRNVSRKHSVLKKTDAGWVLSDQQAHYLDQVAGTSALQSYNWVGQRIPLHATSNGKVLLSGVDRHTARALAGELTAYTDKTIVDLTRLEAELAATRRDGYATAVDELEDGLSAIAAPVRNAHGEVVNSLSLSGPTFRLDAARLLSLRTLLLPAAGEVSRRLGWRDQR